MKKYIISFTAIVFFISGCQSQTTTKTKPPKPMKEDNVYSKKDKSKVELSEEEWKKILTPEVYYIARQKGTEKPYTGKLLHNKKKGLYRCKACGNALFESDTKFESGCGWPSFFEPKGEENIIYLKDNSYGMQRVEVQCGRCKAHLGHVFEDGPPPTGLRYCINSVILDFDEQEQKN